MMLILYLPEAYILHPRTGGTRLTSPFATLTPINKSLQCHNISLAVYWRK